MNRRAYGLLVGVALVMGALTVAAAVALHEPIRDPDGSLGPSWVKLPVLLLAGFVADVVPRSAWRSRGALRTMGEHAREIIREHWTRERVKLVVIGLVTFYVTYVSYRNLKNFLPRVFTGVKDPVLHNIDKFLFLGHEPAVVLHQLLGDNLAAHVLGAVYLMFLPVSPFSLIAFLVWARNISYGYWFATAQSLAWALGTATYYAVPTLGPAFSYPWLYVDLVPSGVKSLQDGLYYSRMDVLYNPLGDSIQSVAGFASLHVGIILTLALVTHYTVRHTALRWAMWVYFGLTVVSTLYFGWHYIADDVAGALIAWLSVWLGGLATGQEFVRHGRAARPTTSTARVPVQELSRSS